ncbi:tRNA N(3)-methylcytidine methyltransferase METTL6-like [Mercenaria mercenaria]|uniref:tRNA N(3)-methylcytidine methyltransferase METTL6-like n=1 Tax=Mercenaria mercenaria TaxID=6596 RepID=UPI00234E9073|nr:tRNA N(3)-methylcytidine methyltransferase METTL6-like [Mercenaria mercenaria]XP_045169233.2 tRNA N(3)-methylcytidine methyltransferase METTL6-like [Mercenaria mercenaria]
MNMASDTFSTCNSTDVLAARNNCDTACTKTCNNNDSAEEMPTEQDCSDCVSDVSEVTHNLRELTCEEKQALEQDKKLVTDFKQRKYEAEAQKNWDLFYKRNTTKFFKDRHWTKREFAELVQNQDSGKMVVFEVGCGVGNFMFPLLEEEQNTYFYACDFSKRAVEFVKENPLYDSERCSAFHCDITQTDLSNHIPDSCVDVATMIFVLSAIHPDKMVLALQNVYKVLKSGGCLLFRDYGQYDYAMLRFTPGHKLSDNFYVRQDGTRAFYFSIEKLKEIAEAAGFISASCDYIYRQTVNKKQGLAVPRIFVQAKFVKPKTVDR